MKIILLALWAFVFQGPAQPTGVIGGMVVRSGTTTPVAGARVNIIAQAGGMAQAVTDDSGRFAFSNLPAGPYRISALHKDYIPGRNSRAGTEVVLAEGQSVTAAVFELTPLGSISGRVFDANRAPVANVSVQALRHAYEDGRRVLIPMQTAATNARGEYSLPSITPASYFVRVLSTETANGGMSRLPVYFPNTTDASIASPVNVPPGLDLNGVDLTLVDALPLRILGSTLNNLTGMAAANAALSLVPRRGTVTTGSLQRTQAAGDGTFQFRNIAPGAYDVVATITISDGERLAGSTPVDISRGDVENVTVILRPQISVSGKISIEGQSQPQSSQGLDSVRLQLRREPFIPELLVLTPNIAPDGTFRVSGVTPGEYQLKITATRSGGYVKAARFGAGDALNPPFNISGPGELEIVVSANAGAVEATVVDRTQKRYADATVVLIPDPPRRRRLDVYYATGSSRSGTATFRNVAPGDYRLFAWDDVPADSWQDPEFLRQYEHLGSPVRVSEAGTERVEARIIEAR